LYLSLYHVNNKIETDNCLISFYIIQN
jgi:hypothetical protein